MQLSPDTIMLPIQTPTIGIETLCAMSDESERRISEAVQDGWLAWAWDVSVGRTRSVLRVLSLCVEDLFFEPEERPKRSLNDVLKVLLPTFPQGDVPCTTLARAFRVERGHIERLLKAGVLEAAPTGRRSSFIRVKRRSVVQFLKERRLP